MPIVNKSFLVVLLLSLFYVVCQKKKEKPQVINLNLPEGSKCLYKGNNGTCVIAYKCLSVLVGLKYKDYVSLCSFKDEVPLVCCTDCELVDDVRAAVFIEDLGIYRRSRRRISDRKCLQYLEELPYGCKLDQPILDYDFDNLVTLPTDPEERYCNRLLASGGWSGISDVEVVKEKFPHIALLGYGEDLDSAEYLCGGTIISEKYILTAAHCISDPKLGPVKYVAVGIQKRTDPQSWQSYEVERIIPHPEYKSPSKYHDIALLELEEELEFDESVLPACLNIDKHEYFEEISYDVFFKKVRRALDRQIVNTTYALAWGIVGIDLHPDEGLQKIQLQRLSDQACSKLYPVHRLMVRGYDNATQMCFEDYQDLGRTCMVDSGSAIQKSIRANIFDCQYKVVGVVSSGNPCGTKGGAGLYTRVGYYISWIESIVWPDED